jgi:hypothetical protein
MMLEAAATLDQAFFYKDLNYAGYSAGFTPGSYTYNDIIARGALNDDITSFTMPDGYSVTLYEDDNYAGASATFTANTPWVGSTWNDRTSSIRINRTGGDGLKGEYYQGMNFNAYKLTRNDENINFNWGNGSPDYTIRGDSFSVRWTGRIKPRYSETYTFYLNSDNGRRLWINNQLVIDQWIDNWNVEYTATVTLNADQLYDIKLEYFENYGGASCKLEWSSPSQAREVVPADRFYTPPAAARRIAPVAAAAEEKDAALQLTASPNPFSDHVRIQVAGAGAAARLQVRLYNLNGIQVKALQYIDNGQQASLSGLPEGMYILQVRTGGRTFTRKLLKH